MKITCRVRGAVWDPETDREAPIPDGLDGSHFEDFALEPYLDEEIADLGVVGGEIRAVVRDGSAAIQIEFHAPEALDDEAIEALREFASDQMSDGIGEHGFDVVLDGRGWLLVPAGGPIEVEQVDDGRYVPPPSAVAIAARDGDLDGLRLALSDGGADLDATHQGYTGLHLAIIYGQPETALLLIDQGADPGKLDPSGDAPLDSCALSSSLDDEDSARVAEALLAAGADPDRVGSTGGTPRILAELRGKPKLLEVLSSRR
ncbi:ankyrin repeat domain-containing protein [Planctomyces sp. SH-PL62]|uniref:ankyrin repeat domain-containing protein n=1 Tax=Planctomyces sp. SH-PL62 TaxID=1636152 RepID=UPI00078ED7F2|nr:ankyrin repeat domain-containing protein [Planctomyces sp. SH-PL62]AMV39822.1 Ankyrin repeats (3 copies) [Planctomyces sp. SH-PL62]